MISRRLPRLTVVDLRLLLAAAAAYVVGSLDFAVLVGRLHGVDIYQVGSGNPGASNVLRTLGRGAAAMVFVGDLLKGVIAAAMGFVVGGTVGAFGAGFFAVVGHCYPLFHRFRGGKGVATGAGVLLWSVPLATVGMALLWVALTRLTKVAAVGSLAAVLLAVPAAMVSGVRGWALAWLGAMLLLIVYRHRGNIRRLLTRSESTVEQV